MESKHPAENTNYKSHKASRKRPSSPPLPGVSITRLGKRSRTKQNLLFQAAFLLNIGGWGGVWGGGPDGLPCSPPLPPSSFPSPLSILLFLHTNHSPPLFKMPTFSHSSPTHQEAAARPPQANIRPKAFWGPI